MRTIVFTNDKGGVGKTTTVTNLAVGLASKGYKILVVDMDAQGDATKTILGGRPPLHTPDKPLPRTIVSLLLEVYPLEKVAVQAPRYPNIYVVASNSDTADVAARLANRPGAQTALYEIFQAIPNGAYDFALIDTGKGLDLLIINALAASDEVIVMATPGPYELDAIDRMVKHTEKVRTRTLMGADHPKIAGILLTNTDHYTVAQDTKKVIEADHPGMLLKTAIPINRDLQKAASRALSIFEFNPKSKGAEAYGELVKEVLEYGK